MSFHKDKADIYKTPHINDVNLRKGYDERLLKDIPLNAPCEKCGHKDALPYKCSYCGGIFCGDHRLPEMHSCVALQIKTIVIPPELEPPICREEPYEPADPVTVTYSEAPVLTPTPGVNPELDKIIREALLELQILYPGCADNLTLSLSKSDSFPKEAGIVWIARVDRWRERILLNDDLWVKPFALLSTAARDCIIHEFGHFVFWKLSPNDVWEWNKIWEEYKTADAKTSLTPSNRYAFKNSQEGFAEAFAAVEGLKYTSVSTLDPLYAGCKNIIEGLRSCSFNDTPIIPQTTHNKNEDARSLVKEKVAVMGKFNELDKSLVEIYDLVNRANGDELADLKKHLGAIEDILADIDKSGR